MDDYGKSLFITIQHPVYQLFIYACIWGGAIHCAIGRGGDQIVAGSSEYFTGGLGFTGHVGLSPPSPVNNLSLLHRSP